MYVLLGIHTLFVERLHLVKRFKEHVDRIVQINQSILPLYVDMYSVKRVTTSVGTTISYSLVWLVLHVLRQHQLTYLASY